MQTHHQQVTLIGHPFSPHGMGEVLRSTFRALRSVSFPVRILDVWNYHTPGHSGDHSDLKEFLTSSFSPDVNVFFINGDEVENTDKHLGGVLNRGAYNIICPMWELSNYPREWSRQLNRFDEIWAGSKFIHECLKKAISKPIMHMPLVCEPSISSILGRRDFGIPENAFALLFFWDSSSYIERKNPSAVVEAFLKVCEARPKSAAHLILKHHDSQNRNGDQDQSEFMKSSKEELNSRITYIRGTLHDNEVKNLIYNSDCLVSLHRAEGYGMAMSEAMYFAKPVIATGYSGNLDFMNVHNSLPVRYRMVEVAENSYPFWQGQEWAEPEIDHAVQHICRLIDDREFARKIGWQASCDIRRHFSHRAIGLKYKNALEKITASR